MQRRSLTNDERKQAAILVAKHFVDSDVFQHASHIACYAGTPEELNTDVILSSIWRADKHCYLPIVQADSLIMQFAHYERLTLLHRNKFGILEPKERHDIETRLLDVVLMPLLAFDKYGNRLGMGGGYYDKSFAFLQHETRPAKPLLIGLAYSAQETEKIQPDDWDVSLDAVITENGFTWTHKSCR